jgi:hypothetical protein
MGGTMNLGAPELLILLIALVPLALTICGIVDAAGRPEEVTTGQPRLSSAPTTTSAQRRFGAAFDVPTAEPNDIHGPARTSSSGLSA